MSSPVKINAATAAVIREARMLINHPWPLTGKTGPLKDALVAYDKAGGPLLERGDLARIKEHIDIRLNNALVGMKEGWDDSVVGFNAAWDIVRSVFNETPPGAPEKKTDETTDSTRTAALEAVAEAARHLIVLFPPPTGSPSPIAQLRNALVALDSLPSESEEGWRPITDDQRDGEIYILWRESGLDPFIGYWDDREQGWISLAGAYIMTPVPTFYLPLNILPPPPPPREEA
jgi:hypothetical protein